MFHMHQGVEHIGERGARELPIEALGKSFQIHIGGIHRPKELLERFRQDIARRHRNSAHADLPAGRRNINRIFEKDHRVVIGRRHGPAAMGHGGLGNRLGHRLIGEPVELPTLRDIPVLTELAGQVTARRPKTEHRRARQEMIEGLLLDGVDAIAARAAIGGEHNLIVGPGTHETQPALALVEFAQSRAQIALDAPVFQGVPVAPGETGHVFRDCAGVLISFGHIHRKNSRGIVPGGLVCTARVAYHRVEFIPSRSRLEKGVPWASSASVNPSRVSKTSASSPAAENIPTTCNSRMRARPSCCAPPTPMPRSRAWISQLQRLRPACC